MNSSVFFKKTLLVAFVCFTTVSNAEDASADDSQIDWLQSNIKVANKHIVPAYKSLAKSTVRLAKAVNELCVSEADVVPTKKIKKQFNKAYLNWAKVQHIKFGPVSFLKRLERIQFWPDKHNSSERQVRKLLNAIDGGEQYTNSQFENKSVAVQGFTALERMLFSTDGVMNHQECQLAKYVVNNLKEVTSAIDISWRLEPVEYAREFELAGRESGTYSSSDEVIAILANALATQLLVVSEYKLGRALPKKDGGRILARQMEAWRSQQSLEMAQASLNSLRSLYRTGFKRTLESLDKALDKRIEKQFTHVLSLAKSVSAPMVSLIETEGGQDQIKVLKSQVEKLEAMIRNELFSTLGFAARFNSLDGD